MIYEVTPRTGAPVPALASGVNELSRQLCIEALRAGATVPIYCRGWELAAKDRVLALAYQGAELAGRVKGTKSYKVALTWDVKYGLGGACQCASWSELNPDSTKRVPRKRTLCKHQVALGLATLGWSSQAVPTPPHTLSGLASLDKATLLEILTTGLDNPANLEQATLAALATTQQADPLAGFLHLLALTPDYQGSQGRFEHDSADWAARLGAYADTVAQSTLPIAQRCDLVEQMLTALLTDDVASAIDDSYGGFGNLISDLTDTHRQLFDASDTQALIRLAQRCALWETRFDYWPLDDELLGWIELLGPAGTTLLDQELATIAVTPDPPRPSADYMEQTWATWCAQSAAVRHRAGECRELLTEHALSV